MAIVAAHHLTEELAVAVFKIHHDAAPGVVKKRALATRYYLDDVSGELLEEENENNNV